MKKINLLLLASVLWGNTLSAQVGVGINDDNSSPDVSAMLDVKSTTKGVLIPRVTTVQRTAIASPATGLLVFDRDTGSFWFYTGAAWTEIISGTDSDNQALSLSGNTLSLVNGGSVNLSGYLDNTDNQRTDVFRLVGNNLELSLQNDGIATQTVNLSSLTGTDNQALSLSGNTLSLVNGGSVNLSGYLDADNLGNHTATTTLNMNNNNITNVNLISTRGITSYDKLRVWNSSNYTIGMNNAMTFGYLNDYAMTFTMNQDDDRGWVWRDVNDAKSDGAASLTTNGRFTVKSIINSRGSLIVATDATVDGTTFNVDATNNRVGVGTATPSTQLDVVGVLELSNVLPTDPGTDIVRLGDGGSNLRIQTNHGYTQIGPANTGWSHFSTDRPRFYFDKGITVDQGLIGSYDEDLNIQTSGTTRMTILDANGRVGVGTDNPTGFMDLRPTTNNYGFYSNHDKTTAGSPYGLYIDLDNTYTGAATTYATRTDAYKNGASNNGVYGAYCLGRDYQTGTGTRTNYGVYGYAYVSSTTGTSNSRGVYGTAPGSGDNEYGGYFNGNVYCTGAFQTSDRKLKTNIQDYQGALAQLDALNVKRYNYKNKEFQNLNLPEGEQIGLIAQDLQEVFPEMVKRADDGPLLMPLEDAIDAGYEYKKTDEEGMVEVGNYVEFLSVNYTNLVPVLIQATKEQQEVIEDQNKKIDAQQAELEAMQQKLNQFEALLKKSGLLDADK